MNNSVRSLKQLAIHIGLFILGCLLPNKIKRITYLTSLHARLVCDGVFQEEMLDKLNETLKLVEREEALKLPASMCGQLWDTESVAKLFTEAEISGAQCLPFDEARRISESLVSMAPGWLKYGYYEEMVVDTIKLFYCQPTRAPQNQPLLLA